MPATVELDRQCLGGLWSSDGYQREIESPNSELLILKTASNQVIGLGCLWAILDEAHITTLAIHPHHRRRKLGQFLLTRLLQEACRRELTHATLEVSTANQSAQMLYSRFGFKIAGRRKKYYKNGEDALILWRNYLQESAFFDQLQQLKQDCQKTFRDCQYYLM